MPNISGDMTKAVLTGRDLVAAARHPVLRPAKVVARFQLAGSMRAVTVFGDDILPTSRKAKAALAYLCLTPGHFVTREKLAGILWDGVPDTQARVSLRQTLKTINKSFGKRAHEILDIGQDELRLVGSACWIDTVALTRPGPVEQGFESTELLSLCNGGLLESLGQVSETFDEWLDMERERFKAAANKLLAEELAAARKATVSAPDRRAIATRVLTIDPVNEDASQLLMIALADLGETVELDKEFTRLGSALQKILQAEPDGATMALHRKLRKAAAARPRAEALVAVPSSRPDPPPVRPASPPRSTKRRLRVSVSNFNVIGKISDPVLPLALAQDVAAELARFRWFEVIMPVLQGDERVGHVLADYQLSGLITQTNGSLRISVKLFDVGDALTPVWSDELTLPVERIADFSERVTRRIVAQIDPIILFIEGQVDRQHEGRLPEATSLVLRAIPLHFSAKRTHSEEAGRMLDRALELDPANAKAAAYRAYVHMMQVGQGWSNDPLESCHQAEKHCVHALRQDPGNAEALGIYAHLCAFLHHDFGRAQHYFELALNFNPNQAFIWALSAPTCCYIGKPDMALERLQTYRSLAPHDPNFAFVETIYIVAYTFKGDYESAVTVGRRAVAANPDFSNGYKPLIAALGHLGLKSEAKRYLAKLLRIEPDFTIKGFASSYPIQHEVDRQKYIEGLRRAGVPES